MSTIEIPNRPAFRAQEVCELAEIPPYVLRTWEAEFPDLGVAKTAGGPRIYRRADVELVCRIKQLLFDEGLTLAGVRRRFADEAPAAAPVERGDDLELPLPAVIDDRARERLREVRQGLQWILGVLSNTAGTTASGEFVLQAEAVGPVPVVAPAKPSRARRAARKS